MKKDKYVKVKCPNCGQDVVLPEWQYELHREDEDFYCSEGCRYNAETGKPNEEY